MGTRGPKKAGGRERICATVEPATAAIVKAAKHHWRLRSVGQALDRFAPAIERQLRKDGWKL